MSRTFDGTPVEQFPFFQTLTPLVCPCGKPLQVGRLQDGGWIMGDFETACSPMISCASAEKMLEKFMELSAAGKFNLTEFSQWKSE